MRPPGIYSNWRFWAWTTAAFIVGVVSGFMLCIAAGIIILTEMTSSAQ